MFYVLEAVNIAAVLLMLSMLVVVIRQQPSRAQMAFVLYDVFTVIFVIGVQLELMHADTVGEALSGLCVQYVGQAGFLMALLWFASEFAYLKIPGWIYIIQAAINTVVLVGVFTAEHHPYFYNSMKILNDGMYQDQCQWRDHLGDTLCPYGGGPFDDPDLLWCALQTEYGNAEKKNPLYSGRKRSLCLRTDIKRRRSLWQLQSGGMCYDHYDVLHDDGNGKIRLLRFFACCGR